MATAATEADKTYGMAWFSRARAHYNVGRGGDWAEAVTSYGTALELGGLTAAAEADAQKYLQKAKDALAAELAAAPAGGSATGFAPEAQRQQAAPEQEGQRRQAAVAIAFEKVEPTEVPEEEPMGGWFELPARARRRPGCSSCSSGKQPSRSTRSR